jgi:hypothetical protein
MEPRGTSSLARLLIISAIDLLLCCFTMAVMLFLVFQPSLRSDVSSALAHAGRTNAQGSETGAVGESLGSPLVLIIRNTGGNQLKPKNLPADFVRIPSRDSTRFFYISNRSERLPKISLMSNTDGGSTQATVWLAAQQSLRSEEVNCDGGAEVEVTIGLAHMPTIQKECIH